MISEKLIFLNMYAQLSHRLQGLSLCCCDLRKESRLVMAAGSRKLAVKGDAKIAISELARELES